jgi:hypothetical protein
MLEGRGQSGDEVAMRKRRVAWIGAGTAAALALALAAAALLLIRPDQVTQANCDRITEGMTEAEVEALFGGPADARTVVRVTLDASGKPMALQKSWTGRRHIAIVGFSPEGTVVWKGTIGITHENWFLATARQLGLPW